MAAEMEWKQGPTIRFFECDFDWEVSNFAQVAPLAELGQCLESGTFAHPQTPDILWRLCLYPAGAQKEYKDHVGVGLCLDKCPRGELKATVQLSLGNKHGSFTKAIQRGHNHGFLNLLSRDEAKVITKLVTKVKVAYAWCEAMPVEVESSDTPLPLLNGPALFLNPAHADVCLKIGPRELVAHRLILASHSPVFHQTFLDEDWEELVNTSGMVLVNMKYVCEDLERAFRTARHFLSFIYTGALVEGEEVDYEDLLVLADGYDVAPLKSAMEAKLALALDGGNFCHMAKLAQRHGAQDLLAACRDFHWAGKEAVVEEEWSALTHTCPDLIAKFAMPRLRLNQDNDD